MGRQILSVLAGVLLSVLSAAAGGYIIHQLWPQAGPSLARYVLNPIISLLVGACVGAVARSRPGILAALALVPSIMIPFLGRGLDSSHLLFMISLAVVDLFIGAAAATLTFRARSREAQIAPTGR
jgi:hypothetical protein